MGEIAGQPPISSPVGAPANPRASRRGGGQKRVAKACDRCRLKKIKCCGNKPCNRCQNDDAVCHTSDRHKAERKLVSAAHLEQVKAQQQILVETIRAMWTTHVRQGDETMPPIDAIVRTHGVGGGLENLTFSPEDESSAPSSASTSPTQIKALPRSEDDPSSKPDTAMEVDANAAGLPYMGDPGSAQTALTHEQLSFYEAAASRMSQSQPYTAAEEAAGQPSNYPAPAYQRDDVPFDAVFAANIATSLPQMEGLSGENMPVSVSTYPPYNLSYGQQDFDPSFFDVA